MERGQPRRLGTAVRRWAPAALALVAALVIAGWSAEGVGAQTPPASGQTGNPQTSGPLSSQVELRCGENTPDVILDVPNLSVEEISIAVERLQARLDLDARVANLVQITAGVDVVIEGVEITIKGVQARLLLVVCLENVRQILDKVLTVIQENPDILTGLLNGVTNLLTQTVNELGQTVLTIVDQSGGIVQRILNADGTILSQSSIGNVLDLAVISETTNAAGQTVRRVRGPEGGVIEVVLNQAGEILSTLVIDQVIGG